MEDFHDVGTHADVELLADEGIGDGRIVALDLDVVVDIHPSSFPLGIEIWSCGQRP
jgi:hypothetical protein